MGTTINQAVQRVVEIHARTKFATTWTLAVVKEMGG
jgi:hypothetical protein